MNVARNQIALSNAITSMSFLGDENRPGFVVASTGPGMGNGIACAAAAQLLNARFDIVDPETVLEPDYPLPGNPTVILVLDGDSSEIARVIDRLRYAAPASVIVLATRNPVEELAEWIRTQHDAVGSVLVSTCHR